MLKRRHIPNALTTGRLVLALVLFIIFSVWLEARQSGGGLAGPAVYVDSALGDWFRAHGRSCLNGLAGLFFIAGVTDFLDGWLARRWNVVSAFGRIADPFADKIVIVGSFVLFLPLGAEATGLAPWMVVAVLAREFLVTSIRGYAESRGIPFPASWWGKAKMMLQSLCVGVLYLVIANEGWFIGAMAPAVRVLVALTVAVTLISGGAYTWQARTLLQSPANDVESDRPAVGQGESASRPAG